MEVINVEIYSITGSMLIYTEPMGATYLGEVHSIKTINQDFVNLVVL